MIEFNCRGRVALALVVIVGVAAEAAAVPQPRFTPLGLGSTGMGVSADGQVVVGQKDGRAYRWTQATGIQFLGSLPATKLAE